MKSHLLDFDALSKAAYQGLAGDQLAARLKPEFDGFLRARANRIHIAVTALAQGKQVTVGALEVYVNGCGVRLPGQF